MYISKKKGLLRNSSDKFYTKDTIAELCINLIKQHLNISKNDLIIEPSAGNGAFIDYIKELNTNVRFYDLYPENKEIIKEDYLLLDIEELIKTYQNIHIVGNPPFGRQSSLAIKFIKKSCEFANSVSFILPKSFKKDSLKKHIPLNFQLLHEIDLPDNSFLVDNIEHDVPCVFQIWLKKETLRNNPKKIVPRNFVFVKKDENPDISFRRVGVNAGLIDININNKSIQSHYFIKFTNNLPIADNIKKLSNICFNFNNTVGPKSISKPELIKEFMKFL